jgi:acetyltransferase-like isoleucine patch superfamily enzyme
MKIFCWIADLNSRLTPKLVQLKTMLFYRGCFGKIGQGSIVYKPLRKLNLQNVFIGNDVYLYKHSRIETIKRWGNTEYTPKIIIGNRVSFEQHLHMTCATKIEIGDDTVVLADVMITDINHSYQEINKNIMRQPLEVKETVIGNYCFIGMGTKIMAGTKLGDNCIVGCNSVVIGEFPGYTVLAGAPAKIIKRYDFTAGIWRKTNSKGEFIDEK